LIIEEDLINKLKEATSLVFFSGAGISAESGIPTFRGKEGLWKKFRPEELANFNAFITNPEMVWEWYNHRKKIIHDAQPNEGHLTIARMQKYFDKVTVVTQNTGVPAVMIYLNYMETSSEIFVLTVKNFTMKN